MLPLKLSVKNFMCYRDNVPPLSFDGIHAACLCGDNGSGKSALLDAITWVLWGESRAKGREQDSLVHSGQTEMEVELEFTAGAQQYRVIRKYAKGSTSREGQSDLQLQVADDGAFRSLTGNTLRETEKKIKDILRMDYHTFINSAFLVQGRADEFSVKQPGQRKEILADILGLSVYDGLEAKAKDLIKDREGKGEALRKAIEEIDTQLASKSDYEAELHIREQELAQLEEEVKTREAILLGLRRQKESLESKKEQLTDIESYLGESRKGLSLWEDRIAKYRNRIEEYEQVIAQESGIEEGYSQFRQNKELDDELNRKLGRLLNLTERISELEKTIGEAEKALVVERGIVQNRIAERQAKFEKLFSLEEELVKVREQLTELAKVEESITTRRHYCQQLLSEIHQLESTNASLEEELKALREKLSLLVKVEGGVCCPLCETELGVEGQAKLKVKLETEIMTKSKAFGQNQQEIEKKRLEHWSLENELTQKESSLDKERVRRQTQLNIIEREVAEAKQAGEELAQEMVRLEEIEKHLAMKDYATVAQQTILELGKERERLGYDGQKHEYVKGQLSKFQRYDELKQRLEEAKRLIGEEKGALASAEEMIRSLSGKIKESEQKQRGLKEELLALPEVLDELAKANESYQKCRDKERGIRDEVSRLKERLGYCNNLEESKREKKELLRKSLIEAGIYKELAEAFGKRGIQALLIEQALPEIEVEANRLLGKMTDNRMSLKLETQRETKKGGTIETLDIRIADELGTRNYEMFSGGEAFRINLALRIALSKLLVKRAGASLPILIIDEGFGTQDSSGREKLVEAINSIQDDFEKILVITHLEELKDAFPVRINVVKTATGSTLSLD